MAEHYDGEKVMNRNVFIRFALIILCVTALYQPSQAQRSQRITGTVVGISGRIAGRARPFTLIVNRYTTQGEVTELNAARQRGEDNLLTALSNLNAGRIQIGNNVGVTANAIIATPWGDGGTKVTVLYQRNVNFYELRYGTRSEDYRFGYAEMFLDRNGRGEGTFIPAARVNLRGSTWEVEDFGVLPARLMGLRSSGSVPIR